MNKLKNSSKIEKFEKNCKNLQKLKTASKIEKYEKINF
jgi:hypothetical protein